MLSGMLNEPIDGQALASELERAPARTEALRASLSAGQLSEQVSPGKNRSARAGAAGNSEPLLD